MSSEDLIVGIKKGLEAWSLQNMVGLAILMTFVALGMIAGRGYLEVAKSRLTLRVASEVWDMVVDYGADAVLFGAVLIGLLVTNPDIMADIKIALPWVPLAFVLMEAVLVIRAFHGGRAIRSKAWWVALILLILACLSNWFGFTFVMEAAGKEYLESHPSATWNALRQMRSDLNPELNMATFLWAGPALALIFVWAVVAGITHTTASQRKPAMQLQEFKDADES